MSVAVIDDSTLVTARPDAATAIAGVPLAIDVLANDDPGGLAPLAITAIGASAIGAVTSFDDHTITYTAPAADATTATTGAPTNPATAGVSRSDRTTYTVRDRRAGLTTSILDITVIPANSTGVDPGSTGTAGLTAFLPATMRVGSDYSVRADLTGGLASPIRAGLEYLDGKRWRSVATTTVARTGGVVTFRPDIAFSRMSGARATRSITMRVRVRARSGKALVTPRTTVQLWSDADVAVSGPLTRADLPYSYRDGCPVTPQWLRTLSVNYWSYSGRLMRGNLVVRTDSAADLAAVFTRAFDTGFRIKTIRPIDEFYNRGRRSPTGADETAMMAGNTSAFNCRTVVGNPRKTSAHSFGVAVDINAFENPYVTASTVYPPGSFSYLRRSPCRMGMICAGGTIATAMAAQGWYWGGLWSDPDYQHLSSTGA